jgi:hypothetical protein
MRPWSRSRDVLAEHELLRLLVGTREARQAAVARISALTATVDVARLEQTARAQSLFPLMAARLEEVAPSCMTAGMRERAATMTQETRHWSVAVEVMTEKLTSALERSGVPVVALKGPIMARELYGDPGLRVTTDIDLLVRPADFPGAIRLLSEEGYTAGVIDDWGDGLPLFEASMYPASTWSPGIDLHWRLHWHDEGFCEGAIRRSRPPDGQTPRLLAPLDLLAALCMIYARDGFWGLRGAADLAAWWDRYGSTIPPGGVEEILREHPRLEEGIVAAAVVSNRLVGIPADRTVPGRGLRRRTSARAVRLANWDGSVPKSRISATRTLTDVLISHGARWEAVARQVWPPASVVTRTYPRWLRRRVPVTALRLYYATRVCSSYLPAHAALLWRSRGERHLCPHGG